MNSDNKLIIKNEKLSKSVLASMSSQNNLLELEDMKGIIKNQKKSGGNLNTSEPSLFEYMDYRQYLSDYLDHMSSTKQHFNRTYFSKKAGIRSVSYLRMIINNERNMGFQTIYKVTSALSLGKQQSAYFEALVKYNQAKSKEQKSFFLKEIALLKPKKPMKELNADYVEYFSKPYYSIVREMVALDDFKEDTCKIAKQLRFVLSPNDIEKAFEVLLNLGLLIRDEHGRLKHSGVTVMSIAGPYLNQLKSYNRSLLNLTHHIVKSDIPTDNWLTSFVVPLDQETLEEIKEIVRESQKKMSHKINGNKDRFQDIYLVNTQIIPLTKMKK